MREKKINFQHGGGGCGSGGRAVASDIMVRSSNLVNGKFLNNIYFLYWKDENKEKEAGMAYFKEWIASVPQ